MRSNGERSLKSLNMKWLVLLAAADVFILLLVLAPDLISGLTPTTLGIGRALATTFMPLGVLLVVNVLPHDVKSMLVYWKPRGVLPGCEAFTKYGPQDPRISMATLKKNVGALPTDPAEQNAIWYKLFKQVQDEPEVVEAHKHFLLYRDMAALSLPLVAIVPPLLYLAGYPGWVLWLAAGAFTLQYVMAALSARWSGIRFVTNVLAIHSARKVAASRARAPKPVQP